VVATLLRLKLTILRHTLRKDAWRVVLLVCGGVWMLSAVPLLIGGMAWVGRQPVEVGHDVLVVAGSLLVLGWAVVPVLVPGLDDSLEIGRFATFGVPVRRLAPALLVAGVLGLPTLFTALVCLAPVLAWFGASGPAAAAAALLAAPVGWITCALAARLSTGVGALVLGSRRSREVGAVIGLLMVALGVPTVVSLTSLGLDGVLERVPEAAAFLGWTPLGLPWAVPAAVAEGDLVGALGRLAIAAGWLALGFVAWTALLRRALVRPPSRGGQVRRRVDAMVPRRRRSWSPGAVAAAAITRRSLRYWGADPRYVSGLLGAVIAPVVIVLLLATVVHAPAAVALSMAPLMAGTIGWGRHNDVAFDGSAFWLHVVAHPPGWADRLGRALGTMAWAVPVTVAVSILGAGVAHRPDLLPATLGASLGVLAAGLAVSAVFSIVLTYPVPAPGESPFAAQMGSVGASMLAQLVTSAATTALCLPLLLLYGAAMWSGPGFVPATLLVGLLGGGAVLAAGVVLGGRVYDARASRVLARLG
jgi:ABC-2 type transport system permease protein